MRFGIMGMQLGMLIPSHSTPEALIASVAEFSYAGLVRRVAAPGFKTVELGGDLALFLPQAFAPDSIKELAAVKRELGLSYTVHLPLWSVETSSPLAPVRQGSARAVIEVIQATRLVEPEVYVLHATGALAAEFYRMRLPELARAVILRQFKSHARESIQAILAETGIPSRRLAVETIEFPFDLTVELAEELDLTVCLDTGHVLVGFSGPIDLFDALERCLPRLAEVHFHDGPWQGPNQVIGYGKDHQALGKGDLDVARFLDRLAAAGFTGPLVFELQVGEALASMDTIRSLCPQALASFAV